MTILVLVLAANWKNEYDHKRMSQMQAKNHSFVVSSVNESNELVQEGVLYRHCECDFRTCRALPEIKTFVEKMKTLIIETGLSPSGIYGRF